MIMDSTTEVIAHFIGLFETILEEARLREAHRPFRADLPASHDAQALEPLHFRLDAEQSFVGFWPSIPYKPLGWQVEGVRSFWHGMEPIEIRVPDLGFFWSHAAPEALPLLRFNSLSLARGLQIEAPGQLAVQIKQANRLSDNDYASIGGHGAQFSLRLDDGPKAAMLLAAAHDLSPLSDLDAFGSTRELASFIETARDRLAAYPESSQDPAGAKVFVLKADVITGTYVNGEEVAEAPTYASLRPEVDEDETPETGGTIIEVRNEDSIDRADDLTGAPAAQADAASGDGSFHATSSVELLAGGNTLINSVGLSNQWLDSSVFAALGNHVELNAIVQVNVWQDADRVGSDFESWPLFAQDPTLAFNVANFTRIDPSAQSEARSGDQDFPNNWAVTRVDGDLVILNWIEQFSFMLDNDVSILSAFGARVSAIMGDNSAFNEAMALGLGFQYDLIFIGGHIFDANLIQQLNVLVDNDVLGAVHGFQTTGTGAVSTGDNLLWNQAQITQIGGADRFAPMSSHYRDAFDELKGGGRDLPKEVLHDSAFAGSGPLRVLYVSGDLINLQYIKQTNILGDSDAVAVAMDALQARPDANWTLSTGANSLVNAASIVDVDASGKTYFGGGHYSDEILIQAELIPSDPFLGARNPNALVNEAVAFLGDDMLDGADGPVHGPYGLPVPDAPHADVMHTMLA